MRYAEAWRRVVGADLRKQKPANLPRRPNPNRRSGNRAMVADLSEASKAEAWAEVADCLKEFETNSGFETELQFAICAGAKAG
jgi:hypothetical protein